MATAALQSVFGDAEEVKAAKPQQAAGLYMDIVTDQSHTNEADNKLREQAIYALGELYVAQNDGPALTKLMKVIRPVFALLPKHKTAKLVKDMLHFVAQLPDSAALQMEVCQDSIAWADEQKRTFLRQSLESRLAHLYFKAQQYQPALTLLTKLVREVKRLDDKQHLVEIQLLESRVQLSLRNVPKARAALTAARTAANGIYCPPRLQAQIDMQAGTLHAEENDYKTAYSYFYEAFEGYGSLGRAHDVTKATLALKYMLLCKIMTNNTDDIRQIMSGKMALKFAGPPIEAMQAIATAYKARSLSAFQEAKVQYKEQIEDDVVVNNHLNLLYDRLLEQNLLRIIEPYSVVDVEHVAKCIELPVSTVERKLSQMILDKKFQGVLDQGAGCLNVYEDEPANETYKAALETIQCMGKVVGSLFDSSKKLA